jgi:hypothetical protein
LLLRGGCRHEDRTLFFVFSAVELKQILLIVKTIKFILFKLSLQLVLSHFETVFDDGLEILALVYLLGQVEY